MQFRQITASKYIGDNGYSLIRCKDDSFCICKDNVPTQWGSLFVAEVTEAKKLSNERSVTYEYYQEHIKAKPAAASATAQTEATERWVCKVCGYVHEGPKSAAAGAMHIQLGGTHTYFGKVVEKPTIGDADRPVEKRDILRANRLLYVSSALMAGIAALAGVMIWLI